MGKIVSAIWNPVVNYLIIECEKCGSRYQARTDRWRLKCFHCGEKDDMQSVREKFSRDMEAPRAK